MVYITHNNEISLIYAGIEDKQQRIKELQKVMEQLRATGLKIAEI